MAVSCPRRPGQSVTDQTGDAASSNVPTRPCIYGNAAGTAEAARVRVSTGTTVTDRSG